MADCGIEGVVSSYFLADASAESLNTLLERSPHYASSRSSEGLLPLHRAVLAKSPVAVIKVLLMFYSDAVYEQVDGKYVDGCKNDLWTALHIAIGSSATAEIVETLLNAWPESARVRSRTGLLPLHVALQKSADAAVVKMLLSAAPETVCAWDDTDDDSWLPLHYAAYYSKEDVVLALLEVWPEGARARTRKSGALLLHVAAQKTSSACVVKHLLSFAPETIGIFSDDEIDSWLPLHYAAYFNRSVNVIRAVLEAWPQGRITPSGNEGKLPLHVAARTGHADAVRLLLSCSACVHCEDVYGRTPLDYAYTSEIAAILRRVRKFFSAYLQLHNSDYDV